MKKFIIGFISGGIIFGSIGVYASGLLANSVGFTPKDTTWKVNNVEEAVNDLYEIPETFKKLTNKTTVTSANLLEGVTAYNSDGTLVTGNISTECITGSFYSSSETVGTSEGIELADFKPSRFAMYAKENELLLYYDVTISPETWRGYHANDNYTTERYMEYPMSKYFFNENENKLYAKNWGSHYLNNNVTYIVCK